MEPPTLINLGFEWEISGDANRNATVEVKYREAGVQDWREALPLLRIGGERVFRLAEYLDYTVPDGFAGSILDLKPETEYECSFTMLDPDGVEGSAVRTVKVRTRGEPKAAADGRALHVYPPDWKGEKQEPAFTGILAAYYGAGKLQKKLEMSMIYISHDIAVIAEVTDRIGVMYAGRMAEYGSALEIFKSPLHPYSYGLMSAFPSIVGTKKELTTLPGEPPDLLSPPAGCRFHPRCPFATEICAQETPEFKDIGNQHYVACWHPMEAN